METLFSLLQNMLIAMISLQRQPHRTKTTTEFLTKLGFDRVVVHAAIDGQELLAHGGRCRLLKGTWRLSHDEVVDGVRTRITRHLRASKLSKQGGTEVWSQYGCARSHLAVLEQVKSKILEEPFVLVVEDDLALGPGVTDSNHFLSQLSSNLCTLADVYPQWSCVLLGGNAVFSHNGINRPSSIPAFHCGDYVMQAHAYLWRQTHETNAILDHVVKLLKKGFMSDNALASTMKQFPGRFFVFDPALIVQDPSVRSNLQLVSKRGGQSGYNQDLCLGGHPAAFRLAAVVEGGRETIGCALEELHVNLSDSADDGD
ncbi:hypothetical protein AK812_SmicGene32399 [Symbiodinium microadriaticum]|uniref:Uncharacterized protein n=1 Tax=Symbiodinium microadriaticum TaxID=2951 RepID=A0A1Q9CUA0_SYMMI|nr:hypothetical protein AK812_SmicGene32399 [Symbiodinium microadriaticum]CAE7391361.1 unnamed protein product [Symbiodinium microadriaticum]CAE7521513.1 unnamed protein product [Symbiodinium sp. KB8]